MRLFITFILLVTSSIAQAQLFGKNDLALQQGIMQYHPKSLNNQSNSNSKISWVTELDKHQNISRISNFNWGIGVGDLRNLDSNFRTFANSSFFRFKAGLVFSLPQQYTPRNWSPRKFNPYFKVAYNIDLHDKPFKEINQTRVSSSVRLGFGAVYKLMHNFGLIYEFSHNQRLGADFRTFYQHNFGIIINFDLPYLPY